MKELLYLNKYFIKYKYHFLLGILFTIIAQIFMLFTPKLISKSFLAIETSFKNEKILKSVIKNELVENILLIIATTIIAGFLTFLMRQTLIVMSRRIEFDLKNEVFRQYENLSQNFYKRNRTGDLMNRISEVDTIILKMAICELLKFPSIPVKVTLNEYLELAKEYSTPKSSIFINGILDNLVKELETSKKNA